jgi:fumarate hydratase, class I
VEPAALELLTSEAIHDINHYLRAEHLQQLTNIVKDPEASPNDRFVAIDLLKNANIAAGGILPMCQDTGTALVMGKKGQHVLTTGKDEVAISQGIFDAYTTLNLRYSQMAPVTTWEEKNTGNNLPPKSKSMPTAITRMSTTCSTSLKVAEVPINHFCIKRPKQF